MPPTLDRRNLIVSHSNQQACGKIVRRSMTLIIVHKITSDHLMIILMHGVGFDLSHSLPDDAGPIASLTLPLLGLPLYPEVFQVTHVKHTANLTHAHRERERERESEKEREGQRKRKREKDIHTHTERVRERERHTHTHTPLL
jgi:hypothetical protein